jgi:hypothetical protein
VPVQCYQPYFYRDNWPMAPVVGCEMKFLFAQESAKFALLSAARPTPNSASRDALLVLQNTAGCSHGTTQ